MVRTRYKGLDYAALVLVGEFIDGLGGVMFITWIGPYWTLLDYAHYSGKGGGGGGGGGGKGVKKRWKNKV